ncbi:MAG: Csp1 family four helix bundle copper storage protein [Gammaproteobacteria bacterium]|nr:Csp1 family four helix bundle copper storage protein [Gammaproteobacteria bacterium]
MDRRQASKIAAGSAAATALMGGAATAAQSHKHHIAANANEDLAREALACSRTGEACLKMCFDMLATGDNSMADCARSVRELVIACDALAGMAIHDSKYLATYAEVTSKICNECREQCLAHEQHPQCRECADACEQCANACQEFLN